MVIFEIVNFESLKRYWKRKRYQKLDDATKSKRKLKIARLGSRNHRYSNVKLSQKLRIKVVSPVKLFAKLHRVYVNATIHLVGCRKNNNVLIGENKVPKLKNRPFPMVSTGTNEIVDGRLILEIYRRIISSRESTGLLA